MQHKYTGHAMFSEGIRLESKLILYSSDEKRSDFDSSGLQGAIRESYQNNLKKGYI